MNKKTKKKLLIILLLLLLLLLAFWLYKTCPKNLKEYTDRDFNKVALEVDLNQTNDPLNDEERIYCPDIILPGWGDLTIKAHTKEIGNTINLYNPERNVYYNCPKCRGLLVDLHCPYCDHAYEFKDVNQNVYFLKFTLALKNGEKLYSSDLVKPGYHINNIVLDKELDVGDYEASILIEPYKSDKATRCNVGEVSVILHVTDTI